jgi:histidinol-phosphate aminotransferase
MKLPKAKIINVKKYEAGLSLIKKKIARIKLSANESALGPSPRAVRAYSGISKNFKRYPPDGKFLREALAKKFIVDSSKIILGSGSDQILELICKAFLSKNDEVIMPKYSFIVYRIYSKINGAKVVFAKENNFTVSVKNILSCVTKKTKIVFLANPNNPTGTYINKKELINLRKKLRSDILLVIDDAYFEYVRDKTYSSGLSLFSRSKNVVITRTFSKIYGLAGLRLGWGHASREIIKSLNLVKPPFNVNRPALFAALAALLDTAWLQKEVKHVNKWRDIMYKKFKKIKVATSEGGANFLLINFNKTKKNSTKVFKDLAKSGILVRNMDTYGIKNSLRVTVGNAKENRELLLKLSKIINV